MIDLPTQKDLATPHHRKAVGALVASIIIFGLVLTVYYLRPTPEPTPPPQQVGGWSEAQIAEKEATLASVRVNPVTNMTPAEIKQKQELLKMLRSQ